MIIPDWSSHIIIPVLPTPKVLPLTYERSGAIRYFSVPNYPRVYTLFCPFRISHLPQTFFCAQFYVHNRGKNIHTRH